MIRPRVTLVVAIRNEKDHIRRCIESILSQDYPPELLEIIVADGRSTDNTRQIVSDVFMGQPNCVMLDNPKITQAAGWNLGIRKATGEIVGIVGGHSELASNYVSKAIDTLMRTGADLVGGPVRARTGGYTGNAIAFATSSRFGVGNATFHYARKEQEVDTVYMGLGRRELLLAIGGFDEVMVRNQDDELSYRLRSRGGRIVCNPEIISLYRNRSTIRTLWKQYFQYGYWKVAVWHRHPGQMQLRQFVPAVFLMALAVSLAFAPFSAIAMLFFGLIAASYILANMVASASCCWKRGWKYLPIFPVVFATLHFAYGVGFLFALVKSPPMRIAQS